MSDEHMSDDYLWNRAGDPDEEVVRLEHLLASLGYREPVPVRKLSRRIWWLAAAAAVVVGLVSLPFLTRGPVTAWHRASGRGIRAGQWLDAGTIESAQTGEVRIEPGSRVRLLRENKDEERFDLVRGTIQAYIWAPPGQFVVDTPSARTVDLGCRYTLRVAEDGKGLLTVELGWVAFETHGAESFIPEGAACVTRPGRGPGTPYFTDAPAELTRALERFDETSDTDALDAAIASARPRDALSLWHLMGRTRGDRRGEVFDRFAQLVRLPGGVHGGVHDEVSREAILHGDIRAFDAAWNALDLGDTDWWRKWKRQW
jgi:hypothetical protein